MDFSKLEKHLVDAIKEQQIKLGYMSETVRLYYPLPSVSRLLQRECTAEQAREYLHLFCESVAEKYGTIKITDQNGRFCFVIPPQGSDYIHKHTDDNEFIVELVHAVGRHGCTLEEVLQIFHRHSDRVCVKKITDGEFDYLVYFENGEPDDFRYCLSVEEGHIMYHRFMPEDYAEFGW